MTDTELTLETVVGIADDQVSIELQGEMVVLSLKDGEYYGLNSVATVVWSLLETPRPVGEIRDALLEEFAGVTEEECTRQLLELLRELLDLQLIRLA